MTSSLSISASGMQAGFTQLDAIASNVANVLSAGSIPATPPSKPVPVGSGLYQPVDVVQREIASGGTEATFRPRLPSYAPSYAPSSPDANADGLIATPNVDLAVEAVSLVEARMMFRANLAAFKVYDSMLESLLDLEA